MYFKVLKSSFLLWILSGTLFCTLSCGEVDPHTISSPSGTERETDSASESGEEGTDTSDTGSEPFYGDSSREDTNDIGDTATDQPAYEVRAGYGCAVCDELNLGCGNCWACALENSAKPEADACFGDGGADGSGCLALYSCALENCCGGVENCLVGDEYDACFNDCVNSIQPAEVSLSMYQQLIGMLVCQGCSESCADAALPVAENMMCASVQLVNRCDTPCYQDAASDTSIACFSWAGWGGPCSELMAGCKDDTQCVALEECINNAWAYDDWEARRAACFDDVSASTESLYVSYMRCILCDACELPCQKNQAAALYCR